MLKTLCHALLWLIILSALFWGSSEILFYYTYTYGISTNPIQYTIIPLLLIALYTGIIWLGFRSELWYVSLFSMLLCPIVYVMMLFSFGSMTTIVEDDYSAGFIGIAIFIFNELCLIMGTLIGISLLIYNRTRNARSSIDEHEPSN